MFKVMTIGRVSRFLVISAILVGFYVPASGNHSCSKYSSGYRCRGMTGRFLTNGEDIGALYIADSDLSGLTSDDFSTFSDLSILHIRNCTLGGVDAVKLFENLRSLEEMNIVDSHIYENILFVVAENKELVDVRLNYNRISTVCGSLISQLPYLSIVDLSDNVIKEISPPQKDCGYGDFNQTFFKLPELKHIRLRNNLIERLQSYTFGSMPKLETLDLSHNKISEIEPFTFNLKYRKEIRVHEHEVSLNIAFNKLRTLRNRTLAGSDFITNLDLSNNYIRLIEIGAFTQLSTLQHLNLSNNRLNALQQVFLPLKALQELNLHKNQLTEIPANMFYDVKQLSLLDLSSNRIRQLDAHAFQGLDSLQTLLLQENELQELGNAFMGPLPRLQVLQIAGNSFSEIRKRAFAGCVKLQELDLSRNDVSLIGDNAFEKNAVLQVLDLRNNALRWLPCQAFFGLRELRTLRLDVGNRLRSLLYVHIAPLVTLRRLSLRLPPGSLCECAAFKQLQVQNVVLELEFGGQEEDCEAFFDKLRTGKDFGDNCTLLRPAPDCHWNKTQYMQAKSRDLDYPSRSTTYPKKQSPSLSTRSLVSLVPSAVSPTLPSSPLKSTKSFQDDLPLQNSTNTSPNLGRTTSPQTSSSILFLFSQNISEHFVSTPIITSEMFTSIRSSQQVHDNLLQDKIHATTDNPLQKVNHSTNDIHQSSSTKHVKNISQNLSLSSSFIVLLFIIGSVFLILSVGVITVFLFKLCRHCRLARHEYEVIQLNPIVTNRE